MGILGTVAKFGLKTAAKNGADDAVLSRKAVLFMLYFPNPMNILLLIGVILFVLLADPFDFLGLPKSGWMNATYIFIIYTLLSLAFWTMFIKIGKKLI